MFLRIKEYSFEKKECSFEIIEYSSESFASSLFSKNSEKNIILLNLKIISNYKDEYNTPLLHPIP